MTLDPVSDGCGCVFALTAKAAEGPDFTFSVRPSSSFVGFCCDGPFNDLARPSDDFSVLVDLKKASAAREMDTRSSVEVSRSTLRPENKENHIRDAK